MIPESLQEIADIVGSANAIKLSRDFGGTEEYIPKDPKPDHPISKCIGLDAATNLAKWAGGSRLEIPRAVGYQRGKLYTEIKEAVGGGLSKKKAARRFEFTTRWVRKICNQKNNEDPNQGNLF
jgi:Mor family transcriptional regulator